MDEINELITELVHLVRISLASDQEDSRLYVARLVRKHRTKYPQLAAALEDALRTTPHREVGPFRETTTSNQARRLGPVDDDTRLSLIREIVPSAHTSAPVLPPELKSSIEQLVQERKLASSLVKRGLTPTRSAVFVGPPGVGKTLTAQWIASTLQLPLFVLDLAAVMSSFLGRSGANVKAALEYAKRTPCILLLDELDAIAKRRGDAADIGELKRLVTVILQEVDEWPASGLLLAATNHPELIDPALWRRFDLEVHFPAPTIDGLKMAIREYLGEDFFQFKDWVDTLAVVLDGESFSDTQRAVNHLRRARALERGSVVEAVARLVKSRLDELSRDRRIELASLLAASGSLSQHMVSDLTGVSRDTIRKRAAGGIRGKRR